MVPRHSASDPTYRGQQDLVHDNSFMELAYPALTENYGVADISHPGSTAVGSVDAACYPPHLFPSNGFQLHGDCSTGPLPGTMDAIDVGNGIATDAYGMIMALDPHVSDGFIAAEHSAYTGWSAVTQPSEVHVSSMMTTSLSAGSHHSIGGPPRGATYYDYMSTPESYGSSVSSADQVAWTEFCSPMMEPSFSHGSSLTRHSGSPDSFTTQDDLHAMDPCRFDIFPQNMAGSLSAALPTGPPDYPSATGKFVSRSQQRLQDYDSDATLRPSKGFQRAMVSAVTFLPAAGSTSVPTVGGSAGHAHRRSTGESELLSARRDKRYHVGPQKDGLYHCPFRATDNCSHKPEKLKCNYDKHLDSHLKPYRCKNPACAPLTFSSTACLLRHEREAHGMHGHGEKPYNCLFMDCDRSVSGNGFPRRWNLQDHMKRVHNYSAPSSPEPSSEDEGTRVLASERKRRTSKTSQAMENKRAKGATTSTVADAAPQKHGRRPVQKQCRDAESAEAAAYLQSMGTWDPHDAHGHRMVFQDYASVHRLEYPSQMHGQGMSNYHMETY